MTFIEILICILIVYICLYLLISRICKCIEHCATARVFSEFRESGVNVILDNLQKTIDKFKEGNYVEPKTDKK